MVVLGTKLHVPAPRPDLVRRPRLTDRLPTTGSVPPRLVLVSAPAGFGKTTLLAEWLTAGDEAPARVAWLSLDEGDNDPRRFLTHLVASVDAGAETAALLETGGEVPTEAVLTGLVNDLDQLDGTTVLALDDYHVIDRARRARRRRVPAGAPAPAGERRDDDPGRPAAAAAAAAGARRAARAARRRPAVHARRGRPVPPPGDGTRARPRPGGDARRPDRGLGRRACSSPASPLRGHDDIAAFVDTFTGSHRFVLDYLVEEVLARQPDDVRQFLLDTSVLGRMTGPLCDAVTGRSDGQRDVGVPRAGRPVPGPARRPAPAVPLPPPVRRRPARPARCRAPRPGRPPASCRQRVVRRRTATWPTPSATRCAGGDLEYAADLVELALPQARKHRQNHALREWLRASARRRAPQACRCSRPTWDGHGCPRATSMASRRGSTPRRLLSRRRLRRPPCPRRSGWPRRSGTGRSSSAPCRPWSRSTAPRSPRPAATSTGRSPTPAEHSSWPGRRTTTRALPAPASSAWRPGPRAISAPRSRRSPRRSPACMRPAWSPTSWARPSCWRTCGCRWVGPSRRAGCTSARWPRPRATPAPCSPPSATCTSAWPTYSASRASSMRQPSISRRRGSWARWPRCWRTGTAGTPPWPGCSSRAVTSTRPWPCSTRRSRSTCPASSPTCARSPPPERGSGSPRTASRTRGSGRASTAWPRATS